jgi:hypothetical protein
MHINMYLTIKYNSISLIHKFVNKENSKLLCFIMSILLRKSPSPGLYNITCNSYYSTVNPPSFESVSTTRQLAHPKLENNYFRVGPNYLCAKT